MAEPVARDSTLMRLILLIENDLHYLVRLPMTREEALDLKERFSLPLGVLNTRFDLKGEQASVRPNGKCLTVARK